MSLGPCAKQEVSAIICKDGDVLSVGKNLCLKPQEVCPRDTAGYKTGAGYHLCKDVCQQIGHAEEVAIAMAFEEELEGAEIFLEGHTYFCDKCTKSIGRVGIKRKHII